MGTKLSTLRRGQQTNGKQRNLSVPVNSSNGEEETTKESTAENPTLSGLISGELSISGRLQHHRHRHLSDEKHHDILCRQSRNSHFVENSHYAVIDNGEYKHNSKVELCSTHKDNLYSYWCKECKAPACDCCVCIRSSHHEVSNLQDEYEKERVDNKKAIVNIHRWILPQNIMIRARMEKEMVKLGTSSHETREGMQTKAKDLKNLLDSVVSQDGAFLKELKNDMIFRLRSQMKRMDRRYDRLQNVCNKYEQLANRPVEFLLFLSRKPFADLRATPKNVPGLAFRACDETTDKVKMLKFLADVSLTENTRKRTHLELLRKPIPVRSFQMVDINRGCHITGVTPGLVWISDYKHNLILTEVGDKPHTVHRVHDDCWGLGVHAVTGGGDLIYIDRRSSIKKLSADCQTYQTLFKIKEDWRPRCIYSSHFNEDLLVGMWKNSKEKKARVVRFDISGVELQDSDNTKRTLYQYPAYITENLNGDVIVADLDKHALIVTDLEGNYRFSYSGPPPECELDPRGVCTDGLGHILVCDWTTRSVQMIDKDGHFLSSLMTSGPSYTNKPPYGLWYDDKSHLLWVGYDNSNRITVFEYLE